MEISIRDKVLTFVDIIMRVPPLFIIDELLKISLGISVNDDYMSKLNIGYPISSIAIDYDDFLMKELFFTDIPYKYYLIISCKIVCCCLGE